ncbi:MFS transporter [Actinomadura vinacea]|uniref:MFS transporter n=1 Tax=Actinomadura vinacea TaxID=115336 RepID=A0ABP5WE27_9ACTN
MNPETIRRRRWYILGVLNFSLLVVVLDNTILNVALKTIADPEQGLGATQSQLEWAINSYTLVFAGLLFTFGVVGDRLGRKRVLVAGMAVFAVASLLSSYAQSPGQLIAARALMGLGGAAIMPQTLSIITNVFEPHERARAIGIWSGAVGVAIAIGPITGGLLLEYFWWGSVFLINVPVIVTGAVLIALLVPDSRNPDPGGLDPAGVVLSIIGLVTLSYGIIQGGERGSWLEPGVLGPIAAGLAVLAAFVWNEARIDHPAFDVRLFRDPRLSAAVAAIALTFFASSGMFFFTGFYLQSVRGLSALQSGAMLLPFAAAQLMFSTRSPALVRRFGAKAVCTIGLVLVAAALGAYPVLGIGTGTPLWVVGAAFFLQGAGMAVIMAPATESVMSALPREKAGAGSALQNTARQVAVAMGVALLGSVLASLYRGRLAEHLAAIPAGARTAANESIEGAHAVAERLGAAGLVGPADTAFVEAMRITAGGAAAIALLGALVVLKWMPGRAAGDAPRRQEEKGARDRAQV